MKISEKRNNYYHQGVKCFSLQSNFTHIAYFHIFNPIHIINILVIITNMYNDKFLKFLIILGVLTYVF